MYLKLMFFKGEKCVKGKYKEYIYKPSNNCKECKYIRYTTELISLRNTILRNKQQTNKQKEKTT